MTLQPDALHQDDAEAVETDDPAEEIVEGDGTEDQESAPEPQDETTTPGEEAPWAAEDEAEARKTNWRPRSEWQGEPPKGFVDDPREWNKRQETLTVVNRRLESELKKAREETARKTESAIKAAKAAFDRQLKAERDSFEARLDRWVANGSDERERLQRMADSRKALADHDEKAKKAVDAEFGETEQELQQPDGPAPEWKTAYASFEQRNAGWYGTNKGMTARAREIAQEVDGEGKFADDPDGSFVEIEKRMKAEYADHPAFKSDRRAAPRSSAVATNGARGTRNGSGSSSALTAEDQRAFDLLVRQGAYGDPKKVDRQKAMAEYLEDSKDI